MMEIETVPCNNCGSREHRTFYNLTDLLLDRPEVKARLVRCSNCGLVYQCPRPVLESVGAHYPAEYDSFYLDTGGSKSPRFLRAMTRYGLHRRVRTVTAIKNEGQLLDIGSSIGSFLVEMRKVPGWSVTGVELDPHAAEVAREQGLDIRTGTLDSAGFRSGTFDAVTLWDVFEHLHDPSGSLEEIFRILKPDGVVVMRVPNLDGWDARLFGRHWFGLDAPRHMYVFKPAQLEEMLRKTGFNRIEMASNLGGHPALILSLRFWMTARGVHPKTRARLIKLLRQPLTRLLTAPLFILNKVGVRGPHVTVVARKQVPDSGN